MIPIQVKPITIHKNQCDYMLVSVSSDEYRLCEEASHNFWANSKGGAYGAGLANTPDDPARVTRTGLLAQMAFAKLCNQPVDLEYREYGDRYDNKIGEYLIDIKCALRDYGAGLIYHTNEWGKQIPLDKDIYVFSYIESDDRVAKGASIVFTGCATQKEIQKCEIKQGFRGNGHMNYVVPFSGLRSMSRLLTFIDSL